VNVAPADPYDALAPHYREYAAKRSVYLAAVDRFVRDHMPESAKSLLDVGSGDGVRAMALAHSCGIETIVLSEASREMAVRCRTLQPAEVWPTPAQELPDNGRRFDAITCLWNVLGHIPTRADRLAALRRMRLLLARGGRLFLDVQNRHNAAGYGWLRVMGRALLDGAAPDERRGDATFTWHVGGAEVRGHGHLFTPAEIAGLLREAGLAVVWRVAIDYATGKRSASPFRGQLAFVCEAAD
jgi:SAM-dependent methyltransferase